MGVGISGSPLLLSAAAEISIRMRIAAFDFGSNAIKCLIAEVDGTQITELENLRAQNRLAAWLQNDLLPDTAIQNTIEMLQPLLDSCHKRGVQKILAVGTESLRKAQNRDFFVRRIKAACGLEIKIISPQQEAELSWKGVTSGLEPFSGDLCLFDSGGASTEFILGNADNIKEIHSLPLGAVSLSHRYLSSDPLKPKDFESLSQAISATLELPFPFSGKLIGTGGGVLACAKVALGSERFDADSFEGFTLSLRELERQLGLYLHSRIEERKAIPGMEAARADIIPASTLLFSKILDYFSLPDFTVSTRGLRHGLLRNQLCPA